ncbi:MAG TPA: ATPase, T2SS/T4P/T4SS family [Polyangiaceae bacterium]|jgi:type II secretory ATPase GspE/PulE/Tfp pilus assembly ATPase PilB-like protein
MVSAHEILRATPVFAPLADAHRDQIAGHLVRTEYPRHAEILRAGDPVGGLYLIESGVVGVFVTDEQSGQLQIAETLQAPDSFGEVALFTGATDATYAALAASVVYRLDSTVFFAVAGQVPQVGMAAARAIGDRLNAARRSAIPWVSLKNRVLDARLWALAPERIFREGRLAPLELQGATLTVAMVDPEDAAALDRLAQAVPALRFKVVSVNGDDWSRFVDSGTRVRAGESGPRSGDGKRQVASRAEPPLKLLRPEDAQVTFIDDEEAPKNRATAVIGPQAVALVNEIISVGLLNGASDIHVEHDRRGLVIRYRIDGSLRNRPDFLSLELGKALVSRFKILAKLDITDTRKPQDGRISVKVGAKLVDLRLSTMPAKLGEKLVLRVLDATANIVDLKSLFAVDRVFQGFSRMIFRPHGLVLVTGPTGSGKTTTLYSALNARRAAELNLVTVEDPIEYHLDGITQIQVQPEIGNTFAALLRSLLRQDPDMIMVGETRDQETAKMAVEAATTGHLVLTSAHANSAAESVVRLTDLGVDRRSLGNALVGVIHQRLVRRTCAACAEPFEYPAPLLEMLVRFGALPEGDAHTLKKGRGCEVCLGTGFKGRAGVYELLVVNESVRDAIAQGADIPKLNQAAASSGSLSLARYAGFLIQSGLTAPSEVLHLVKTGEG